MHIHKSPSGLEGLKVAQSLHCHPYFEDVSSDWGDCTFKASLFNPNHWFKISMKINPLIKDLQTRH